MLIHQRFGCVIISSAQFTDQEQVGESQLRYYRKKLKAWGKENFRSFPWRRTHDPYKILSAEVMLHRTQARQVEPVFDRFISRYPSLDIFLQAKPADLREYLQPLGLNWRIELLYQMGQVIAGKFGKQIPVEKTDLLCLPGVSEYIASAVRCFAWNLPETLVDTNTVRIAGRFFNWEVKDSSRRSSKFREALDALLDPDEPRDYNYALLDLAALVCLKKKNPICQHCPLNAICQTGKSIRNR